MTEQSDQIIFHIDGDAFFASCEQSTDMSLRGKPIAVGRERGVATAFSYEAKALGVTRGMSGKEIKEQFPNVLLVSSDYRKYGLYSRRFKNIVRNMCGEIEGMSIDECFVNVTYMAKSYKDAYMLAAKLQNELCTKLGMTFSIGVGPNKTIAKIASGMNKPRGITVISDLNIKADLYPLHISCVSGIGFNSVIKLEQLGVYTIADLVAKPDGWTDDFLSKPYRELVSELQGNFVKPLVLIQDKPKSISKIRAFTPATTNVDYLKSEFARNAEIIAKKMHRQGLQAKHLVLAMKTPKYEIGKNSIRIDIIPENPIVSSQDLLQLIELHFDQLYLPHYKYRATYVSVHSLNDISEQYDLFGEVESRRTYRSLSDLTQTLEKKHGPFVLHTAASMSAIHQHSYIHPNKSNNDVGHYDGMPLMMSPHNDKVLYIPYLGVI